MTPRAFSPPVILENQAPTCVRSSHCRLNKIIETVAADLARIDRKCREQTRRWNRFLNRFSSKVEFNLGAATLRTQTARACVKIDLYELNGHLSFQDYTCPECCPPLVSVVNRSRRAPPLQSWPHQSVPATRRPQSPLPPPERDSNRPMSAHSQVAAHPCTR